VSGISGDFTDEEKLLRLSDSDSRAPPDGKCVVSSDQVYSTGDTFKYGQHMWYVSPSFVHLTK